MKPVFKKVSILVLEGCTPMSPIGAMEILSKSGELYRAATGSSRSCFEVELVGLTSKRVKVSDNFYLDCHTTLDQVRQTDLVLIPAIETDVEVKLAQNGSAIAPLLRLRRKGAELGSMCTGAFILAATGLLNNRSATTHWASAEKFRLMFPTVELLDDKIIVDEDGIYTSGGGASSLNLCLYLVEKYCGREHAIHASKVLLLDFNRYGQLSYSIFRSQTQHDDDEIRVAQNLVETSGRKVTVEQLASKVNLSKRSFIRRFKASAGCTPIDFIQRVNVEKAKRLLETSRKSVEGIVYSLGYRDVNSFRKIFLKHAAISPNEYRKKYERA